MVWVDVPDNDQGDFRCQRDLDVSSFFKLQNLNFAHFGGNIGGHLESFKMSSNYEFLIQQGFFAIGYK